MLPSLSPPRSSPASAFYKLLYLAFQLHVSHKRTSYKPTPACRHEVGNGDALRQGSTSSSACYNISVQQVEQVLILYIVAFRACKTLVGILLFLRKLVLATVVALTG